MNNKLDFSKYLSNFQAYTQYIPLSIYDLQSWMGSPSIYVYDCSNAGMIIQLFNQFAEQHEKELLVSIILFIVFFSSAINHIHCLK